MTTRIGYHYSDWDYADNETVARSWDINLTPEQYAYAGQVGARVAGSYPFKATNKSAIV